MKRNEQLRWIGVTALAVVLVTFGLFGMVRRIGAQVPTTGIEWVDSSSGPLAISVDGEGPGWAAGIRPGDLLLSIDDRPARDAREAADRMWEVDPDGGARMAVKRGAETLEFVLRPASRSRPEPYGYLAVVGLAFFVSGVFITLRWPGVRGGREYAGLAACMFTHLVFSHTGRGDGLDWIVYWLDVIAGACAPALLLQFVFALSRRALPARRATLALAWVPALLLLGSTIWLSPATFDGASRFADPVAAVELRERAEPLFLAIAVLISIGALSRSYQRSSSTLQRSQLRWLLWGLLVGLMPFVAFYAVPFAAGAMELPSWAAFVSVLPMLFVPGAFTAALARYRLFDLSLLLRRGLAEVTTVFAIFAIYAVAREAGSGLLALSASGARYVGILVAAVAYPQLRNWVRTGVDRAFYRERYSYRATLLDWARELSAETDLSKLLERLSRRVCETLALDDARAMIRTGETRFELLGHDGVMRLELDPAVMQRLEDESSVAVDEGAIERLPWARWLFAMKVEKRVRAVLVTADRHAPEEPLSTEDRALLGTLSAHAATAIEAARLLREVRRRAEEVEQLHARQERILETSAVGLLLTDPQGRILAWNRALEEIYALPREEATGRLLRDVFPLHLTRRLDQELGSVAPGEQARIYRHTLINRAGQRVIVNLALTPADVAGNLVITFDDVSQRVKLEEQVLQQERLASLGMLAAGVAHEVNTPLTGISSYTQFLIEELPANDPRRETLDKIEEQTRRASNIVNSLLNMSRTEDASFEVVDLNETIHEVLQLFEPQTKRRSIQLVTELDPALPTILGHRGKIQQVLLNLLINARDAIHDGGRIRVCTLIEEGRVVAEVIDNGTGIADEDLPRIFDPFFTTKERGEGTGLGLSISYGIVREHRGEMRVESEPGRGTRFRLEFPTATSAGASAGG